jgi:exopolysaccharide biosynthesis polyprenyl glycosylphosphotransferase
MSVVERAQRVEPCAEVRRGTPFPFTRIRRALAAADLLAATGGIIVVHAAGGAPLLSLPELAIPGIVLLAKLLGRYDHDDVSIRRSTLDEIPSLLSLAAVWVVLWSMFQLVVHRSITAGAGSAVMWLSTTALLITLRAAARRVMRTVLPRERVLIVGNAEPRVRLANCLATDPSARLDVVGFLPLEDERRGPDSAWRGPERRRHDQHLADLPRLVDELGVERVLLVPTTADSETMFDAVRVSLRLGINVSVVPRLLEVVGSSVDFDPVGGVMVLGLRRPGLTFSSRFVKRAMDIAGAAVGLLVLAPLFALAAVAIRLDSDGPVFFRQLRIGRDGKPFEMLKFRSMVDGADRQREALAHLNETDGVFKVRDDPRITRVGRLLRRASVDELPQLINVLRGDMSLVGPRPLVVDEDLLIEGHHRERLSLAPGMTGPWQVLGPVRPPLTEMVKTDYLYAMNWSLWADLKILLRTLGHVVRARGL